MLEGGKHKGKKGKRNRMGRINLRLLRRGHLNDGLREIKGFAMWKS